ncbi:hypothetical protein DFH09DRAFT_928362 [Mycena vulgaris]|nr:hypothetical protein DFH09DRAFT_928362 [Mycena vulgaris]
MQKSPFDDVDADVILCSSDDIEFRLCRAILTHASPFFKNLFSIPQPADASALPVIPIDEPAAVLDRMLRFWYPGAEPRIDSLEHLREALDLMIFKYDIQFVVLRGRSYLVEYLTEHTLAVFALACHYQWEKLARLAAGESLRLPHADLIDNDAATHLRTISADLYQSLLLYHKHCGEAAVAAAKLTVWGSTSSVWLTCRQCPSSPNGCRQWMSNLFASLSYSLKETPTMTSIHCDIRFLAPTMQQISNCRGGCSHYGFPELLEFLSVTLPGNVATAIQTVSHPDPS